MLRGKLPATDQSALTKPALLDGRASDTFKRDIKADGNHLATGRVFYLTRSFIADWIS
jgi:hypothetical protein